MPFNREAQRKKFVNYIKSVEKEYINRHYMDAQNCSDFIVDSFTEKLSIYNEHMAENGKITINVFAIEAITGPFIEEVLNGGAGPLTEKYCEVIEQMWLHGDDNVQDALEGSIIDIVANNSIVWAVFLEGISQIFAEYISENVLSKRQGEDSVGSWLYR